MPRNVEIKAHIEDWAACEARVAALADSGPTLIEQDDTFFPCPHGRLKLRAFSAAAGELIFYQRPDQRGPKLSTYIRAVTNEPDVLRETLRLALGELGRVAKQRTLYVIGRTRVHLDHVDGLGDFLELEVVLEDHEPLAAGEREAAELLAAIGVTADQLVEPAYLDLLRAGREGVQPADGPRFGRISVACESGTGGLDL